MLDRSLQYASKNVDCPPIWYLFCYDRLHHDSNTQSIFGLANSITQCVVMALVNFHHHYWLFHQYRPVICFSPTYALQRPWPSLFGYLSWYWCVSKCLSNPIYCYFSKFVHTTFNCTAIMCTRLFVLLQVGQLFVVFGCSRRSFLSLCYFPPPPTLVQNTLKHFAIYHINTLDPGITAVRHCIEN